MKDIQPVAIATTFTVMGDSIGISGFQFNLQKSSKIEKFVKQFESKLPRVVKIVDGFESPDGGKFTFGSEEVRSVDLHVSNDRC